MGRTIIQRIERNYYPTDTEQKKTEKIIKEIENEKTDFSKFKFPDGTPVKKTAKKAS